jgi:hypothetical protein
MSYVRIATVLAGLVFSAHLLAAQQPSPAPGMAKKMEMGMTMEKMDSMNARMDSMVNRMNQASGNRKINAMADVITEMAAQHRAMQERMRAMRASHHDMMMNHMGGPAGTTPADSAGHEGHHPPS